MRSFPLVLRKCIAVLFTAFGFVAGAGCLYGFGLYSWRWRSSGALGEFDHRLWVLFLVFGLISLGILTAGLMLLRPVPLGGDALTKAAGPRRRQAVFSTVLNTIMFPLISVFWFCILPFPLDPVSRLSAAAAGLLTLYFGVHVFTFCHELGHLAVAALLRMDISRFQVGTGPLLLSGRVGPVRCEWRALHGGGAVYAGSTQERGWRWRRWLMIAGGPAAHAATCVLLACWLRYRVGPAWPHDAWWDTAGFFAIVLFYYEAYRLLMALLPRSGFLEGVPLHTDGYWLLRAPFLSPAAVRQNVIAVAARRADRLWEDGRRDESCEQIHRLQTRYPDSLQHAEGHLLAREGKHAEAAATFRRQLSADGLPAAARDHLAGGCFLSLVRSGDADGARRFCADFLRETAPDARAGLLDAFATNTLLTGLHDFLPDADAWTQELLTLEPDKVTYQGTRGGALIELGRHEEGEAMLQKVWRTSRSGNDAAISAFYLGIAARNRGRKGELRR